MNKFLLVIGLALLSSSQPANKIVLYDPISLNEVGYKDKQENVYKFNSGLVITESEIKAKIELLKSNVKKLSDKPEKGVLGTSASVVGGAGYRRACESWLMHEGGVGCAGVACNDGFVYEYCWDIQ